MNQKTLVEHPPFPRVAFVSALGFGGSTTFLCNLAGELSRRGVPVIVVSPERENPFSAEFQSAGVKVYLHDDRRMIFEDRMVSMLDVIAQFQPAVVVSCLGPISYEVLRYLPRGVRRVGVVQTDGQMHFDGAIPCAGSMDDVVGISRKITERFEAMEAFRDARKHCLLHGVSVPQAMEPRKRKERPLHILYFGRIEREQKRVHLFPRIHRRLLESGIPFVWTIAGEGAEREWLEREMPTLSPEQRVVFTGAVVYSQVPTLLRDQDVMLLASDSEGLPMSLLEAMVHGLVPVITDLESGVRELVDSTNGIRVPMEDVEGYARAIIHLHEHRDELAAKSAAAHARVRADYSVQAMADRWLRFLSAPPKEIQWPSRWRIRAPMMESGSPRFWPPVRVLRRLAVKFRP
jgi:glycosyltransferase involved in cell wall biosynthesis